MGSFSDPAEFPGLAHFLEHMLFYASARYPKEVRTLCMRSALSLTYGAEHPSNLTRSQHAHSMRMAVWPSLMPTFTLPLDNNEKRSMLCEKLDDHAVQRLVTRHSAP